MCSSWPMSSPTISFCSTRMLESYNEPFWNFLSKDWDEFIIATELYEFWLSLMTLLSFEMDLSPKDLNICKHWLPPCCTIRLTSWMKPLIRFSLNRYLSESMSLNSSTTFSSSNCLLEGLSEFLRLLRRMSEFWSDGLLLLIDLCSRACYFFVISRNFSA